MTRLNCDVIHLARISHFQLPHFPQSHTQTYYIQKLVLFKYLRNMFAIYNPAYIVTNVYSLPLSCLELYLLIRNWYAS